MKITSMASQESSNGNATLRTECSEMASRKTTRQTAMTGSTLTMNFRKYAMVKAMAARNPVLPKRPLAFAGVRGNTGSILSVVLLRTIVVSLVSLDDEHDNDLVVGLSVVVLEVLLECCC